MSAPKRYQYVRPSLDQLKKNEEEKGVNYTPKIVNTIRNVLTNYLKIKDLEQFKVTDTNTEGLILQYLSSDRSYRIYQLQKYIQENSRDTYKLDTYLNFNLSTIFIAGNKIEALLKIDSIFTENVKSYGYRSVIGEMMERAIHYFVHSNDDIKTNIETNIGIDAYEFEYDIEFLGYVVEKYAERFTDYILDKYTYNLGENISNYAEIDETDEIINLYVTENKLI